MKLLDRYFQSVERISKVRTLAVLRDMPEHQLRDLGISKELLDQGISGAPWRIAGENWQPRQSAFKTPVGVVGHVSLDTNAPLDHTKSAA